MASWLTRSNSAESGERVDSEAEVEAEAEAQLEPGNQRANQRKPAQTSDNQRQPAKRIVEPAADSPTRRLSKPRARLSPKAGPKATKSDQNGRSSRSGQIAGLAANDARCWAALHNSLRLTLLLALQARMLAWLGLACSALVWFGLVWFAFGAARVESPSGPKPSAARDSIANRRWLRLSPAHSCSGWGRRAKWSLAAPTDGASGGIFAAKILHSELSAEQSKAEQSERAGAWKSRDSLRWRNKLESASEACCQSNATSQLGNRGQASRNWGQAHAPSAALLT